MFVISDLSSFWIVPFATMSGTSTLIGKLMS
jgi:hypothetical protein